MPDDAGPQTIAEALDAEAKIADEAAAIRAEHTFSDDRKLLDFDLFLKLWPLLCRPIQPAFIQSVAATKGKPYPSTGIRSVQVQIDRMNNVLTPVWWWYEDEYALEGKLCTVTVYIAGDGPKGYLLARSSRGGVQQGSSMGNIHKGSFTNAAKLAFARLGVGHEVYIGAIDLDPDVSQEVAAAADAPEVSGAIGKELASKIVDHAWQAGEKDRLRLAASRLAERDVGDCSTKAKATEALTGALTFAQAERLDKWLAERKGAGDGAA